MIKILTQIMLVATTLVVYALMLSLAGVSTEAALKVWGVTLLAFATICVGVAIAIPDKLTQDQKHGGYVMAFIVLVLAIAIYR